MPVCALLLAAVLFAGVGVVAAPVALAGPPYQNCTEARADGAHDMTTDDPGYAPKLDRDNDGVACES